MATYTPKTLAFDFLTTSAASILAGETGKVKRITAINLHNINTTLTDVYIWFAPADAGSLRTVAANDMYHQATLSLSASDSVTIIAGFVLSALNDSIQMKASVGSKISGTIDYIEEA